MLPENRLANISNTTQIPFILPNRSLLVDYEWRRNSYK